MKHKSGSMELNEWTQSIPRIGMRFTAVAEGGHMVAIITAVKRIRHGSIDQLKKGDGTHLVEFELRPDVIPVRVPPKWLTGINDLNRTNVDG